jgi:predicted RNA binding protein YcfA (HicA-like mRNA interferase family)
VKFREFIQVIEQHGFTLKRTEGSHRRYEGVTDGRLQLVTIAYHSANDDIRPKTLSSMVRQSGYRKDCFAAEGYKECAMKRVTERKPRTRERAARHKAKLKAKRRRQRARAQA